MAHWAMSLLLLAALLQGCGRDETPVGVAGGGAPPERDAARPRSAATATASSTAAMASAVPVAALKPGAAPPGPAPPAKTDRPAPGGGDRAGQGGTDGPDLLARRSLIVPVEGVDPSELVDTYSQGRPGHLHEAIDIAAPRGTPVLAVDDGKLVKLFTSVPGGLTAYQFDPEGNLAYYYAHLDRYADGLREGAVLRRGDLIGFVGTTGNSAADAPHLHFAVFRLGPERQWWKGTPVNPYPALRRAQPAR